MIGVLAVLLAVGSQSAEFMDCFYGPAEEAGTDCRRFDYDLDGNIDLRDYQYLQLYQPDNPAAKYCTAGAGTGAGSAADPWGTIAEAMSECADGDTILLSGTFDEALTLSTNVSNKTIVFDGQGSAVWTYSAANTTNTIFNPAANDFDITFRNMTITRINSAPGSFSFFCNNAASGNSWLRIRNCWFDHEKRFLLHNGGSASDPLNVEISDCPHFGYGTYCILTNNGKYMGEINLRNTVFEQSVGPNAVTQSFFLKFSGSANSIDSLTMDNCTLKHVGDSAGTLLDTSSRVANVSITHNSTYWRAATHTDTIPPINIAPSASLVFSDNAIYEQGGGASDAGAGTRSASSPYHWVSIAATAACDLNISNNIISAFGSAENAFGNSFALSVCIAGGNAVIDNNTIISGSGGIRVRLLADSGTLDITNNSVTLDNTNSYITCGVASYSIGEQTNTDPTYEWQSTVNITDNYYNGVNCTQAGQGMFIGRDVNYPGGNNVLRNTLISPVSSDRADYCFYLMGSYCNLRYNKCHGRSAMTTVGMQNCVIEFNTFTATRHTGAKGMMGFNVHADAYPYEQADNIVRYNVFDCHEIDNTGGPAAIVYTENAAGITNNRNVLCDYNWYALRAGDNVSDHLNDDAVSTTVEGCAADWINTVEAHGSWSGVAGNDAHSVQSLSRVIADPINGDFTPNTYLNGWGAMPFNPAPK